MILDTSALIAILRQESEAKRFSAEIEAADHVAISAATLLEASIVADRSKDRRVAERFSALCREMEFQIVPFDAEQARIAREAYRDFGRGSGHPARLNFGDCFAYALAKAAGESLLFKGDDFRHTDVTPARPK